MFYVMSALIAILVVLLVVLSQRGIKSERELLASIGNVEHKYKVANDEVLNAKHRRDTAVAAAFRLNSELAHKSDIIDGLRKDLKELQSIREYRQKLSGVKFTALLPDGTWTRTNFQIGEGPCGLTVDTLTFEESADRYMITQRCTNGERKEFVYFRDEVKGHIEKTFRTH